MAERAGEIDVETALRRGIGDPGSFTPRGDNYEEPMLSWQARAVMLALEQASYSIVSDELLSEVAKVYDDITQGMVSKPNTLASAVIQVHGERCWYAQEVERLTKVVDAADAYVAEFDKEDEEGNTDRWNALHDALVKADS